MPRPAPPPPSSLAEPVACLLAPGRPLSVAKLPGFRGSCARWALAGSLALGFAPAAALAAEGSRPRPQPGAYCALPEPGEKPACLDPAKQAYGTFFDALDSGEVADGPLADVEETLARGAAADPDYLALSSLTYGYYRLAQQTAAAEDADPVIVERLSRWNTLLARAYRENASDAAYQASVARAARELRERAPVSLPCLDAQGREAACTSTEAVIRGFNATTEAVGVRGALERLLVRLFGGSE